jgi:hypothetical protein
VLVKLLDDSGILVVNTARDRVKDDVVIGWSLLVQRSDGHQATRAATGLRAKIALPTGGPEIPSGDELSGGLVRRSRDGWQVRAGLSDGILEAGQIIPR